MKRFFAVAFLAGLAGCASQGGSMGSSNMGMSGMGMSGSGSAETAGMGRPIIAPGNYNTNGSWSPGSSLPDVRF